MQLKMSFAIDKVLADARVLANRLKEHDSAADSLIAVTQTMYRRVDSMRQYQEDLNELNEIARHRPRSNLILGLIQENSQIRELQQENKELRACLEEHQSALELIMSKYREQMVKLVMANKMDRQSKDQTDGTQEVEDKLEKIVEMAAIMQKAIRIDEHEANREREHTAQLLTENKTLRELLLISYSSSQEVSKIDRGIQADLGPLASLDSSSNLDGESQVVTTDDEDHHFVGNDMNASVIENKSFTLGAPDKASSPAGTWGRETTMESNSSDDSADKISLNDVQVGLNSSVTEKGSCVASSKNCAVVESKDGCISDGEQSTLETNTLSNSVTLVNHSQASDDSSSC